MTKEEIMKARVEKNLKVLKLLKDNDANINAEVKAKINLATMKDVMPMEKGDDLNGLIAADIKMKGRMSSIEKEKLDSAIEKAFEQDSEIISRNI